MTETQIVVGDPLGIHARPAAQIVRGLRELGVRVTIRHGEKQADGASLIALLSLGAKVGSVLTVQAEGEREGEAAGVIRAALGA